MSLRVSDGVIGMVRLAIDGLDTLQVIKDRIEWEVIPMLKQGDDGMGILVFMVGIGLAIPGTNDRIMPFILVENDQQNDITRAVRILYASVQKDIDEHQGNQLEERTPGGLLRG